MTTTSELLCAKLVDFGNDREVPATVSLAIPMTPYPSGGGFEAPVPVPVKDVAIHHRYGTTICVIDTSDALWCVGRNSDGQFGNGTTTGTSTWTPTAPGKRWRQISTNENRSVCGLTLEGQVFCWSLGTGPILGQPINTVYTTPQPMPYPLPPMLSIAHANNVLCGITTEGQRYLCWGDWAVTAPTPSPPRDPGPIPGLPATASSLGGGPGDVMFTSGGRLYRFGGRDNLPTMVPNLSGVTRLLTSVSNLWCVEHETGTVICSLYDARPVAVPLPAGP